MKLSAAPMPKRPRPRRQSAVRLTAWTTAIAGAALFIALTQWGANARQARPVVEEADRLAELAGLGVQQVYLTGHRMTSDRDIFDALDLTQARSLLRFDSVAARERIERLPWIKTAAITRIFPDSISIEVVERKAFAVWEESGKDLLIDATGRVLGLAPPSMQAGLPRFVGRGANEKAAALLSLLEHQPYVRARLKEAVRVAGRRWTLRLAGGLEIHLPAGREAEALARLSSSVAASRLLDANEYAAIDLRPADRIIIRPVHDGERKTASSQHVQPSG
ncbi:MAG TPA: cell division protein FtsQ/DivIB [Hyphomicrobiaceae bacterium]